MAFYLSLKQVPELQGLSPSERKKVHRACYFEYALASGRCWMGFGLCGLCAGLGGYLGRLMHFPLGLTYSMWQGALGAAAGGAIGGVISGHIVMDYLRPFYAAYIKNELRPRVDVA